MAHVLVIDDSELALEFSRSLLEESGHSVATTTDPTEFMRLAETGQPRPNLAMVDAIMPEITGPELITQLREHSDPLLAGLPVLLCSALEILTSPAEGVLLLTKPFGQEELEQALNLLLG